MQAFMQTLSLEVIIRTIFRARDQRAVGPLASIIPAYFKAYTALLVYFPPLRRSFAGLGPWNRFTKIAGRARSTPLARDSARRHEGEREDILSLLLATRYDDGRTMTDAEVRDELKTLLVAGHETVAIALAWAFYWVHRQPDVYQRLQTELHALGVPPVRTTSYPTLLERRVRGGSTALSSGRGYHSPLARTIPPTSLYLTSRHRCWGRHCVDPSRPHAVSQPPVLFVRSASWSVRTRPSSISHLGAAHAAAWVLRSRSMR